MVFTGVCSGLANYFGAPVFLIRLIFFMLLLWGGAGLAVYITLTLIIKPDKLDASGKIRNELFFGMFLLFVGLFFAFEYTFIWRLINVFGLSTKFAAAVILFSLSIVLFDRRSFLFVPPNTAGNNLALSAKDKKLTGVCGGIAHYFNLNSNLIRMLWIIFTFATAGFGALIYAVLLIILKTDND